MVNISAAEAQSGIKRTWMRRVGGGGALVNFSLNDLALGIITFGAF